jgi:hypothetical protein
MTVRGRRSAIEASQRGILTLVRIALYPKNTSFQLKLGLCELTLRSADVLCASGLARARPLFLVAVTGIRRVGRKWDQRFESAFLQR